MLVPRRNPVGFVVPILHLCVLLTILQLQRAKKYFNPKKKKQRINATDYRFQTIESIGTSLSHKHNLSKLGCTVAPVPRVMDPYLMGLKRLSSSLLSILH